MDGINLIRNHLHRGCRLSASCWCLLGIQQDQQKQFDEAANLPFADDEEGSHKLTALARRQLQREQKMSDFVSDFWVSGSP